MIAVVISDDCPGFREHFYKGPFETEEEAQNLCDRFNEDHQGTTWSSWTIEPDKMPHQEEWEKGIFQEYVNRNYSVTRKTR